MNWEALLPTTIILALTKVVLRCITFFLQGKRKKRESSSLELSTLF